MSDKIQKIRQEIERLKHNTPNAYDLSRYMLLEEIESFIDNLPEEHDEDLDFQTFAEEMHTVFALPSSETKNTEEDQLNWEYAIARHFAEWGRIHK